MPLVYMSRYFSSDLCIVQPSSANLQPHKKTIYFPTTHTMNIVTTSNILWKTLTDGSSLLTISSCELFLLQPFPKKRRKKIICTALECWEPSTLLLHFGGNLCCNHVFLRHIREKQTKKKYWPDCKKPCPYPVILEQVSCLWKTVLSAPASLIDLFWRWK